MREHMSPEDGNGSVRVTLTDVYKAVEALQADVHEIKRLVPDHESRIRRLEAWKYALPTAAVIAMGSIIIGMIEGTH